MQIYKLVTKFIKIPVLLPSLELGFRDIMCSYIYIHVIFKQILLVYNDMFILHIFNEIKSFRA